MNNYLKQLWKRKRSPIKALLILVVIVGISFIINPHTPTNSDLGIAVGAVAAMIIWLGPIVVVRAYKLKIKNTKPVFVEPKLRYFVPLLMVSWIITFFVIETMIALTPLASYIDSEVNTDTIAGNAIMALVIFSSIFIPICVYTIWIFTHYKKIIEYDTPRWHKFRS